MDNPSESTSLDVNGGAAAFAALLEPQEAPVEPEKPDEEKTEPKVEAEGEQPEVEAEAKNQDDPLVTIKVDGQEIEVPLSELKNGYQRQADYTRKTMEVSEQRKAAEAETQKAQQERQQYAANLQRMQSQLEVALQDQQNIRWDELFYTDRAKYEELRGIFQERQATYERIVAERGQLAQQMQAEEQQRHQEHLKQQRELLVAKLPEWSDPKKAQAETAEIRSYLIEQGFPEQLVDTLADANMVVTARKAMLFDRMVAKAKAAEKKVATLPTKVEKPGTGANPGLDRRSSNFQKLGKTGRVEDAASVFRDFL